MTLLKENEIINIVDSHENDCFVNSLLHERKTNDKAFMGATHALSALSVFLMIVAFVPEIAARFLGSMNITVLILACIVTIGAALMPDLDNSVSHAKNSLGLLGKGLSIIFRGSSIAIQTVVRTKRDDSSPDPHRGFWHTVIGALVLGGLTLLATRMTTEVTVPVLGNTTYGVISAFLITFISCHIALTGIATSFMHKIKKSGPFGELISFAVSGGITLLVFMNLPSNSTFEWLAISIVFGCVIHIIGDAFTKMGVPLFFPLTGFIKGKFWWKTRFAKIEAGGPAEKMLFIPIFSLFTIIPIVKITLDFF